MADTPEAPKSSAGPTLFNGASNCCVDVAPDEDSLGNTLTERQTPQSYTVGALPVMSNSPTEAFTREPTDAFATLSAKQDHLERCIEKCQTIVVENQTRLEAIVVERLLQIRDKELKNRAALLRGNNNVRASTRFAIGRKSQRLTKRMSMSPPSPQTYYDKEDPASALCHFRQTFLDTDGVADEGDMSTPGLIANQTTPTQRASGDGAVGPSGIGPSGAKPPISEKLPVMPLPPDELDPGASPPGESTPGGTPMKSPKAEPKDNGSNGNCDQSHEKLIDHQMQSVLPPMGTEPNERMSNRTDRDSHRASRQSARQSAASAEQAATLILGDIQKVGANVPAQRRKKTLKRLTHEERGSVPWYILLLENSVFDSVCAFVILLNSVLIGFNVEYMTDHDKEADSVRIITHVCNVFFLLELMFRMWVHGVSYFTCEDRRWNMFDFALVFVSVIDVFMLEIIKLESGGSTGQIGSGLKILKMLRIVRIFRVFRFFKELSLLALMIMDSLKSLMWALLMLTIIIYVFAICFTQGATDHIKEVHDKEVYLRFGSLARTTYSLVQAMLNGLSWGIVCDALMEVNVFMPMLFFFYIAFTILAVLNIITGVFVDNAVETAKTEREFLVQKEMELKEKYIQEMRDLFAEMDQDGSGTITHKELAEYFDDTRVQSYFQALGLDPNDTERLFNLLDDDDSGEVSADEFLDGCLRLKGPARSIDVHTIMYECKRLMVKFEAVEELLDESGTRFIKKGKGNPEANFAPAHSANFAPAHSMGKDSPRASPAGFAPASSVNTHGSRC